MPFRGGRLTPKEHRFAEVFAKTGDVAYARDRTGIDHSTAWRMTQRPAVMERVAAIREKYLAEGVALAYERTIDVLRDRKARNADTLMAADKMFKAGHQYQPAATGEAPIEEGDPVKMLAAVDRKLVQLIEHRPGEYAPAEPPTGGIFD